LAKVIKDADGIKHLRGADSALCGKEIIDNAVYDDTLTCPDCSGVSNQSREERMEEVIDEQRTYSTGRL